MHLKEVLDDWGGVEEWFHYDSEGNTHIETVQDCEPILDFNKAAQADANYTQKGIKEEFWHYATIPVVVQLQWLNEYGHKDWPMLPGNETLLYRLLNSPEWKYLKVTSKYHTGKS